ncbi:GDP-mannose 4,6-dehydratase [Patescibacteria group bacterium]|nr:GDP-mannose 4,6-dehydratase [Patescibacteria group bacterium]
MEEQHKKRALITGVTGQDGSYLAELLLEKGYVVCGVVRRASYFNTKRIDHLYANPNFDALYGDLTDHASIANIIEKFKPDEIYNLGAMSQVGISFEVPVYTMTANTLGVLNILEYIRQHAPKTKFYQASSSEIFGAPVSPPPFNENSDMKPQSPYGVSKLAAFHLVRNYREGYGLFATTGILFNHESPRRGENFVTRKITRGIAAILRKEATELRLGNLDAVRDWGHSKDYVKAIHLIMQQPEAGEYVVATGEAHSVREALEFCFGLAGLDWKKYVVIDKKYFRPNEVPYLKGDASKIRDLGWQPEYNWQTTLKDMLENDIKSGGDEPSKYINFPIAKKDDKTIELIPAEPTFS